MANLLTKYRPKSIDTIYGNKNIKDIVKSWGSNIPHGILLVGDSGTGKTTIARIIASLLPSPHIEEVNAAQYNGKDDAANLVSDLDYIPLGHKTRVQIIDEAQRLTPQAQQLLLKPLEDCREFNYTILATTNPEKILPTVKSRLIELRTSSLDVNETGDLFDNVYKAEKGTEESPFSDEFIVSLFKATNGHPRAILNNLQKVIDLPIDQINDKCLTVVEEERTNKSLVKSLVNGGDFSEISNIIKDLSNDEVESVRRGVLGYATAIICNGKRAPRLFHILEEFKEPFFNSDKAGILLACHRVIERR